MFDFLIKRLAQIVPTLVFVSMLIFGLQQLLPGDPAKVLAGEEQDPSVIAHLRLKLNLDEPLPVRYGLWVAGVLRGDLGESVRTVDKPCRKCQGVGRIERTTRKGIRIPAGVDTGTRLRSAGDGEAGGRGGPPGDLFVVLHVRPHSIFQREGDDLVYELPVSFVQAALGAEIEVPSLNGKVPLRIPTGTQTGQMFRVKGKGIKNAQGYGWGDLHVRVNVELPAHLNAVQRAKLQEFAELCDEKVNPITQGFFEKAKSFFK